MYIFLTIKASGEYSFVLFTMHCLSVYLIIILLFYLIVTHLLFNIYDKRKYLFKN